MPTTPEQSWSRRYPGVATLFRIGLVAGIAGTGVVLAASGIGPSASDVREWGDDLEGWGLVVWPFVFTAANMMLPWPLVAGATGAVFGAGLGTVLSVIGILMCTSLQWFLARHGLGPDVRGKMHARYPRFDEALARNDYLTVFYTRLAPVLPWGVINYAGGVARVRLGALWFGTLTAGVPKIFAYTTLGGSLDNLRSTEAKVAVAIWIVMAIIGLVAGRKALRDGIFTGGATATS